MSAEDEGFLKRWSRRKTGEPVADKPAEIEAAPKAALADKPAEEEPFDLSKLPSIESLGKTSDYSMFMHKAVPEDLRLKALRRMWATDPVLAAPDLLDMHAWDYTGNDGIKPLVTPALEAIAAAAREALERTQKAAEKADPDSPPPPEAADASPKDEPEQGSG